MSALGPARACGTLAAHVVAALALAGCPAAPLPEDPYVVQVTQAARAERADRWSEAADDYARAATLTADARVARTALLRSAQTAARGGDDERALAVLRELAEQRGTDEAGRALYDAAGLSRDLGREADAEAFWLRLIRQEPDYALSELAVGRLYEAYADRSDLDGLARLLADEATAAGEDHVDLVAALRLYRARALGELDRPQEAYATIEEALAHCAYPACAYWDDLPWEGAQIARRAGDSPQAIAWIDRLLFWKEECWLNGSYYSDEYDDAQELKAEILRDDLGDPAAAADAFLALRNFTDSRLRDDGLYEAALLFLDRLGEPARGCDALRELLDTFPDSNRRRAATERLAQPPCR